MVIAMNVGCLPICWTQAILGGWILTHMSEIPQPAAIRVLPVHNVVFNVELILDVTVSVYSDVREL